MDKTFTIGGMPYDTAFFFGKSRKSASKVAAWTTTDTANAFIIRADALAHGGRTSCHRTNKVRQLHEAISAYAAKQNPKFAELPDKELVELREKAKEHVLKNPPTFDNKGIGLLQDTCKKLTEKGILINEKPNVADAADDAKSTMIWSFVGNPEDFEPSKVK